MSKIVLFGCGQMAEIAHVFIEHDTDHEVVAFCVDREHIQEKEFRGLPVVAFEEVEQRYPPSDHQMFILLGARETNRLRERKYNEAKSKGYSFISYVSSKATICPESHIGENCLILENNVIQPFASIGDNCVLWSGNHIGHHSSIRDHCYLASHIVVSGRVTVHPYCYLGVNATIRDGIEIAPSTVVGAGALIMKPTEEGAVYMGLPGRKAPMKHTDVDLP